jgi:hypothetical protein
MKMEKLRHQTEEEEQEEEHVDGLLGMLFSLAPDPHESFHFKQIQICPAVLGENGVVSTEVHFQFAYCNRHPVTSKLLVEGNLTSSPALYPALFSIGMCLLSWYWMHHGCKRIIIPAEVHKLSNSVTLRNEVQAFWQHLYTNVLLEYLYCNECAEAPVLEFGMKDETGNGVPIDDMANGWARNDASSDHSRKNKPSVKKELVPLGGNQSVTSPVCLSVWFCQKSVTSVA